MKVTLDNGMVLEGTPSQVSDTLNRLGVKGDSLFYNSDSRGLILIEEMKSTHLRNAILKTYKVWIDSLYAISDPKEVAQRIVDGPQTNPTLIAMIRELHSRPE